MRTTRESWSLNMPSPYNYLHALKYSRMNGDVKHQTQIVALCVYLACHHIVFTHTGSETESLCVPFVRMTQVLICMVIRTSITES